MSWPLSVVLFLTWLVLDQPVTISSLAWAAGLALIVPWLTRSLRPGGVRLHDVHLLPLLIVRVLWDMTTSSWTVGRQILTRDPMVLNPRFVSVPLELRDPYGLATLAMICCITPGTCWAELSLDRSRLLIHVFHLDIPEDAWIVDYKARYEAPLIRLFEGRRRTA